MSASATSVREKAVSAAAAAAASCSVKRYATAFIHTQMRFIGPPRTFASLHHSTPKSTSSDGGDDEQRSLLACSRHRRRSAKADEIPADSADRPIGRRAAAAADVACGIARRWIDRDQNENPTDPTRPDAGRLICNRVGSGRRAARSSSPWRQTRVVRMTMHRRRTDYLTD